jgi:hypothetical protein
MLLEVLGACPPHDHLQKALFVVADVLRRVLHTQYRPMHYYNINYMVIKKSITHKCKYLSVLPRLHELLLSVVLRHPNFAVGVPVADALNTCLVVHPSRPTRAQLV